MSESQASAHALDYIEKTIAGKPVRFGKLSVRDRERILQAAKKSAREQLASAAADAKIPAEQAYVELRAHDTGVWGLGRWVELVNSYEGQSQIYAAALRRQKHTEQDIEQILSDLSLPQEEEMELICELANLPLVSRAPVGTKQIGTLAINGQSQPLYIAVQTGAGDENPTQAAPEPPKEPKQGNPVSYGK